MVDCTNRLNYLVEKFKVFTKEDIDSLKIRIERDKMLNSDEYKESYDFIHGESNVIGVIKTISSKKIITKDNPNFEKIKKNISLETINNPSVTVFNDRIISVKIKSEYWVSEGVFEKVAKSDPTPNLIYMQWLLNNFVRYLKIGDRQHAKQYVEEDLNTAFDLLLLFDEIKLNVNFLNHCKKTVVLNNISDYSDIYRYKNLSQLYNALDPFISRSASALEKKINKFVAGGQAKIDYRDKDWMVYIPLTSDASEVFADFASWCTARRGNSMFDSYTTNNLDPFGKPSNLYIIINGKIFEEDSNCRECYQLHCESGQLKDVSNGSNVDIYDKVINEGLGEYFKEKLLPLAKAFNGSLENNHYATYLMEFGYSDIIFELKNNDDTSITFNNRRITNLPDLKNFNLLYLNLVDCKIEKLHYSLFDQVNLVTLSLHKNKITEIPSDIQKMKKLSVLNLEGNPIETISDSISELDSSNGGSLIRIVVSKEIEKDNINKLNRLLPNVTILDR